jgi:hypothetical protein
MKTTMTGAGVLLAVAVTCWACGGQSVGVASGPQSKSAQSAVNASGELRYKAPDGWVIERTSSNMRVAQYKLPRADGDVEDASLVLYYFGSGQGGSVQANLDRWISQMQQPDGSSSKDKAKTETITISGLKATTVDVSGTYTAEMSPGSGDRRNDAGSRLRAAVIETPKGSYYAKLIGPARTVERWNQSFDDYLKSFEFK